MARSRNIKPAFFNNDELAELSPITRLYFIGLWTICDFRGCLEYRAKKIKAQILPYDDVNIEELTINLDQSRFISIYSVQGKQYLKILNFTKHQNPHKNEKSAGSEIPDITQNGAQAIDLTKVAINPDKIGTAPDCDGTDPADSLLLIPDSLLPNKTLDQSAIDPELFEQFWRSGIRKVNKKKSLILFNNLLKKQPDPKDFTTKLIIDVKTRFDSNQLGFAEMHPTTYLNGERWNDEVKPHDQNQFRSNSGGHKLSVVERTRLANEERERARQARESHGPVMGAANGNLRPPVEQSVWPNDTGELGAIIDGDFTRSA
jgi:hypothetical protein